MMDSNNTTTTAPLPRKTYPQDWPRYNAAQVAEKSTFTRLLADLCSTIEHPTEVRRGRPNLPLSDMLFACASKVYSGFSARRFSSDVQEAQSNGFIGTTPHFNSVNRYIADADLSPIFKGLIERSALPLVAVESKFAIDASGFSTSRFERWFDHKWGKERSERKWLKAHIITGVRSNIVTAVEVTDSNVHDSRMFKPLVTKTADGFTVDELSADRAYLSDAAFQQVVGLGGTPYIPFKSNTTGEGSALWRKLYAYFTLNEADFNSRYHLRSNVESTFSMVKRLFGDSLRSKSDIGQTNEILLKFLCHNLVVLVHEIHKSGIDPNFRSEPAPEPQIIDLNQYRLRMGH